MKPRSRQFEVNIEKIVYGGSGLARHEGKVVFVPFVAPGDRALVRPVEEKKNYLRASLVELLEPGRERVAPPCPHFGRCGGCQWQHLDYPRQVETKRQILTELCHHRLPSTRELIIAMRACPQMYGYRSRARLQVRSNGASSTIGFFRLQSHTVEDIELCPLFRPVLNKALASVRAGYASGTLSPGCRQIEIASSEEEGSWSKAELESTVDDEISALGRAEGDDATVLFRKVGGSVYAVSPYAFFQANDFMVGELAATVQHLAQSSGASSALDLYSGAGLFTLRLAQHFERVTAVESSPMAHHLCSINASQAGFENINAVCADVSAWMKAVGSITSPHYDLVVLDPPRTGAGPAVMKRISEWAPESILYVSCDPQTLLRDLALLPDHSYEIELIEGLDLFPQTYHFETVVHMKRR